MTFRLEHDWFDAPLPSNAQLGEGSWLYSSFAFRHFRSRRRPAVVIGDHSGVYKGSFFNLGPRGRVKIGDFSTIVGAIFCTDTDIEIGSYTFVAHEVVLADRETSAPSRFRGDAFDRTPRNIQIGDNVWIGARAVILGGVTIGDNAIIGAATVVRASVPAGAIVAGNPSRVVGQVR